MKYKSFKITATLLIALLGLMGLLPGRVSATEPNTAEQVVSSNTSELPEILYYSDTLGQPDGKSGLYSVALDEATERANLTLLPNGILNYNYVDTLALNPNGSRLYFVDEGLQFPISSAKATFGFYDLMDASIHEIGIVTANGNKLLGTDQAAFSPGGELYITSSFKDKLYILNLTTAVATEVGAVTNQATGVTVDIGGGDIAFSNDGVYFLMWTNREVQGAPKGLYRLSLPAVNGKVEATFLGAGTDPHFFTGLAFRKNGAGDLAGSTGASEIHVVSRDAGADTLPPFAMYLNGQPFISHGGDMSTGPLKPGCTLTPGYWKTHSKHGPAPSDDAWFTLGDVDGDGNSEGADETFFLSGQTYYEVLWTAPHGNAYYILSYAYIAAKLNILNGAASIPQVNAAITYAENFFNTYTPSSSLSKSVRDAAIANAGLLDDYNNGLIGPGHCSE